MTTKTLVLIAVFILSACSTTDCKYAKIHEAQADAEKAKTQTSTEAAPAAPAASTKSRKVNSEPVAATVKVYKSDGTKQCSQVKGADINTMEKDLKGIAVISKEKMQDGRMRIQMCGADAGWANVYEINVKDLEAALKLGFKKWDFKK